MAIAPPSLHPVALAWLGWCVLVSGLLAIRQVSVPGKIAANVWAGFCAFTLIIGVLVGTYSSIYVASTTLLQLGVSKFDLLQVEKEGAAADQSP